MIPMILSKPFMLGIAEKHSAHEPDRVTGIKRRGKFKTNGGLNVRKP